MNIAASTLADIFTAELDMDAYTIDVRSGILKAVADAYTALNTNVLTGELEPTLNITPHAVLWRAFDLVTALWDKASQHAQRQPVEQIRADYLHEVRAAISTAL